MFRASSLTLSSLCFHRQAVPFCATEEDVRKKNGRIYLGYPGVVCRHCLGVKYEGRYFFSSVESLTACYTVLEKHFLKCSHTPVEAKERIRDGRLTHNAQRKAFKQGSQQAYFTGLWKRLKSAKIRGRDSGTILGNVGGKVDDDDDDDLAQDFTDYLDVLDHARRKLKKQKDLQEAVDRYYSCIDYSGRVYKTESMPKHYSPQWLLAKVCPKDYTLAPPKRNVG